LMFLGAWGMFWQEYYGNWGGYLLYSPDLHLLPWGSTWWTGPNKPIFIIFSYPVFFTVIYTVLSWLTKSVHRLTPGIPLFITTVVVSVPLFYGYNFVIDASSVDAGIWNYVHAIGPITRTSSGGIEPMIWPPFLFCFYAAIMLYSLIRVDANGHPTFLRLGRPERFAPGWRREIIRALTSIFWWNLLYWFLLNFPMGLVRQMFGPASSLVP